MFILGMQFCVTLVTIFYIFYEFLLTHFFQPADTKTGYQESKNQVSEKTTTENLKSAVNTKRKAEDTVMNSKNVSSNIWTSAAEKQKRILKSILSIT
jgi:hypothetical protein